MKKLLSLIIIISFFANAQSIEQQLNSLKISIKEQQKLIDKLNTKLNSSTNRKQSISLEKYTNSLKISGSLRFRYETRERNNASNRQRLRQRFRLGLQWETKTNWSFNIGLTTGSDDARSANDTFEQGFETGDIRLDYATAIYKDKNGIWAFGQQKNPFLIEGLFFDSDIRPVGISYKGRNTIFGAFSIADASVGINNNQNGSFGVLFAAQVFGKVGKSELRGAIYHYTNNTFEQFDNKFLKAQQNSTYTIIDFYGSTIIGQTKLYANIAFNFGADGDSLLTNPNNKAADNNFAWTIGVKSKMGNWNVDYAYASIDADALVPGTKDSDFGNGASLNGSTDVRGHIISLKRKITNNAEWNIKISAYGDIKTSNREIILIQSDIKYKF